MAKNDPTGINPSKIGTAKGAAGRSFTAPSDWRRWNVTEGTFQGLQVFYPVDPYKQNERKEFRSAMNNVYVYRATRIMTTLVVGQGFSTEIMPRIEEEVEDSELQWFNNQQIYVPYWDQTISMSELKERIDKLAVDVELAEQVFNGYYTSLEQGRCVLAMTPLNADEESGKYPLPEQIRYIRPEFTLRPILDANTAELRGCYIVGARSNRMPSAIEAERMLYITHGFNNELFSDFYGDSKVSRISDIANNLNLVLNQDYERVAEQTWHKPNVWLLPIPPQMAGKEEQITAEFLTNNNQNAKGRDIAIPVTAVKDENIVQKIPNSSNQAGDVGALETIRVGLVKAIVTAFGMPGFLLDEGDYGALGGNVQMEQVDMYLNTEIRPERLKIENMLEKQFYDRLLCILFDKENPNELEVRIRHRYNKPTVMSLLNSDMLNALDYLVQKNWIGPRAVMEILHLEQYQKETLAKGEALSPDILRDTGPNLVMPQGWNTSPTSNLGQPPTGWKTDTPYWGKSPLGAWTRPSNKWLQSKKVEE